MSSNEKAFCKHCQFYHQHYALNNRRFFRVFCGYCTHGRPKTKRPDASACEHFILGVPNTDAFASREFLSKELLKYVLNLELLPEIEEYPL